MESAFSLQRLSLEATWRPHAEDDETNFVCTSDTCSAALVDAPACLDSFTNLYSFDLDDLKNFTFGAVSACVACRAASADALVGSAVCVDAPFSDAHASRKKSRKTRRSKKRTNPTPSLSELPCEHAPAFVDALADEPCERLTPSKLPVEMPTHSQLPSEQAFASRVATRTTLQAASAA